jgi:hypothetical protein
MSPVTSYQSEAMKRSGKEGACRWPVRSEPGAHRSGWASEDSKLSLASSGYSAVSCTPKDGSFAGLSPWHPGPIALWHTHESEPVGICGDPSLCLPLDTVELGKRAYALGYPGHIGERALCPPGSRHFGGVGPGDLAARRTLRAASQGIRAVGGRPPGPALLFAMFGVMRGRADTILAFADAVGSLFGRHCRSGGRFSIFPSRIRADRHSTRTCR